MSSVKCKYSATLPKDVVAKIQDNFSGRDYHNAISLIRKVYTHKDYDRYLGLPLSSDLWEKYLRRSKSIFTTAIRDDLKILHKTKKEVNTHSKKYAAWYRVESSNHFDKVRVEYEEYFPTLKVIPRMSNKVKLFIDNLTLELPPKEEIQKEVEKIVVNRIDQDRGVYVPKNSSRRDIKIYEKKVLYGDDRKIIPLNAEEAALWNLDEEKNIYLPNAGKETEIYNLFIKTKSDSILGSDLDALSKIDHKAVSKLFPKKAKEKDKTKITKNKSTYKTPQRNDTNNRLDSPLTNLSSYCMDYLRYDGQPLIEYDLSNSQPTLLIALLKGNFTKLLTKRTISNESYDYKKVKEYLKTTTITTTLKSSSKVTNKSTKETTTKNKLSKQSASSGVRNEERLINTGFSALSKEGKLYEYVCEQKDWDINNSEDKIKSKQFVFSCIYGGLEPGDAEGKKRKQFMIDHFSDIVTHTDGLKTSMIPHFKKLKKKHPEQYKEIATKWRYGKFVVRDETKMAEVSLPILLQRIEAYLFISKIFADMVNLSGTSTGIPCATKHDSVLIPQGHEDKAEKIIRKYLDKYIGAGEYQLKKTEY